MYVSFRKNPFLLLLLDDGVILISSFLNNGLFPHFSSAPLSIVCKKRPWNTGKTGTES